MSEVYKNKNEIILDCDCGLTHKISLSEGELKLKTLFQKNDKPKIVKPKIEKPKENKPKQKKENEDERNNFERFFGESDLEDEIEDETEDETDGDETE